MKGMVMFMVHIGRKRLGWVLALVVSLAAGQAMAAEYVASHTPPDKGLAGNPLSLTVGVSPAEGLSYVVFSVRIEDGTRFKPFYAELAEDGQYRTILPESFVKEPGVEYFIMAVDANGEPQALAGSADDPFTVPVESAEGIAAKEVEAGLAPSEQAAAETEEKPSMFGGALAEEFALMAAEDVVESAARRAQRIEQSPSAITVITADDIRQSGLTNLPDILTMAPGLHNIQISATDQNVGIRGFAREVSNRILVLIDGRSVYTDFFGTVLWDAFPISIEDIQRIEIIRGPGSTLYGANAFTGVINITTRKAEGGLRARLVEGNFATDVLTLSGELANEEKTAGLVITAEGNSRNTWDNEVEALAEERFKYFDDPEDLRDKRSYLANVRGHYGNKEDWQLSFSAGTGASNTILNTQAGQFALDIEHFYGQAKLDIGERFWVQVFHNRTNFDLLYNVGFAGLEDRVTESGELEEGLISSVASSFDDNREVVEGFFKLDPFAVQSAVTDGEVQLSLPLGEMDQITLGGNVRMAETLIEESRTNQFSEPLDLAEDFSIWGLYLQNEFTPTPEFNLNLGGRVDSHPITGTLFSPRIAATYAFGTGSGVRANIGQAFRNPSFFESKVDLELIRPIPGLPVFRDGFSLQGNDKLDAETVTAYELGLVAKAADTLRLTADLYYNQIDNFITIFGPSTVVQLSRPESDDQRFGYRNSGKADAWGGELGAVWDPVEPLRIKANYSHWRAISREDIPFTAADEKDASINDWPEHIVNLMATAKLEWLNLSVWSRMISVTRWRNFMTVYGATSTLNGFEQNDPEMVARAANDRVKLNPVRFLNARVAVVPTEGVEFGLAGFNLLNERANLAPAVELNSVSNQTGSGINFSYPRNSLFGERSGRLVMVFLGAEF